MPRARFTAVAIILVTTVARPQPQQPAFSAASVKRNTPSGAGLADIIIVRPGQLLAQCATLSEFIQAAYGVERNQVVDGGLGRHFTFRGQRGRVCGR